MSRQQRYDLAVIGGGASGMMAAIAAKRNRPDLSVLLLERMDRVGKKLLATGNGRCNFTNDDMALSHFYGERASFAEHALRAFGMEQTKDFFASLGIYAKTEARGRVFPYSGQASSVLDVLRTELAARSVSIVSGVSVLSLRRSGQGFRLAAASGDAFFADAVILATGGKASPALGSDGSGYALAESLGHHTTPLSPVLVQLKTTSTEVRALQGIRCYAQLTLRHGDTPIGQRYGELLFTATGFSGPPIFDLSIHLPGGAADLQIDFVPELSEAELLSFYQARQKLLGHLPAEQFFTGLLHKRIGNMLCRRAGIAKLSTLIHALSAETISLLAEQTKGCDFAISGTQGFESAQATFGGLRTDEFDAASLQSRLCPGLFACGELLDITGDCGGYNLQWAWSSGYLAGLSSSTLLEACNV